jgi:hypothetical protein
MLQIVLTYGSPLPMDQAVFLGKISLTIERSFTSPFHRTLRNGLFRMTML